MQKLRKEKRAQLKVPCERERQRIAGQLICFVLQEEAKKAVEQRLREEKSARRALAREDQTRSEAGLNDDAPKPKLKPKSKAAPGAKPAAAPKSGSAAANSGKAAAKAKSALAPPKKPKQKQPQPKNKKGSSFTTVDT